MGSDGSDESCNSSLSALPVSNGVKIFGNAREVLKTGASNAYTVQTSVCNLVNLLSSTDDKLLEFCDFLIIEGKKCFLSRI